MFIEVNNAKIYTTAFGSRANPAVLGIGGWIGSWELWAEPFSILSQDWYTIAYDHRGSGATVAPIETITFDTLVEDLFAVLDTYEVESCVLAAESAGALTALGAALKRPERISGLVLVDGLAYREPAGDDPFLMGLQKDYSATVNNFVEACVPGTESEHIKRWGRQIVGRASQGAAIALYLVSGQVDLRRELGGITQPALILHGSADSILPVVDSQWLAGALPNAQLVVIEGAGHVPTVTHPEQVAGEMASFLKQETEKSA